MFIFISPNGSEKKNKFVPSSAKTINSHQAWAKHVDDLKYVKNKDFHHYKSMHRCADDAIVY